MEVNKYFLVPEDVFNNLNPDQIQENEKVKNKFDIIEDINKKAREREIGQITKLNDNEEYKAAVSYPIDPAVRNETLGEKLLNILINKNYINVKNGNIFDKNSSEKRGKLEDAVSFLNDQKSFNPRSKIHTHLAHAIVNSKLEPELIPNKSLKSFVETFSRKSERNIFRKRKNNDETETTPKKVKYTNQKKISQKKDIKNVDRSSKKTQKGSGFIWHRL